MASMVAEEIPTIYSGIISVNLGNNFGDEKRIVRKTN